MQYNDKNLTIQSIGTHYNKQALQALEVRKCCATRLVVNCQVKTNANQWMLSQAHSGWVWLSSTCNVKASKVATY